MLTNALVAAINVASPQASEAAHSALVDAAAFCTAAVASGSVPGLPAGGSSVRYDPKLPQLVRDFIAVPPRFGEPADLTIVRFDQSESHVWAITSPGDPTCEIMVTQSRNVLRDRSALYMRWTVEGWQRSGLEFPPGAPFWKEGFVGTTAEGKIVIVSLSGTAPENTNASEIQMTAEFMAGMPSNKD